MKKQVTVDIDKLIKYASMRTCGDIMKEDPDYYFDFGGNQDDAYHSGENDGQTYLARIILEENDIEYEIEK